MKSINFISKMMNWVKKDQVKHLPSIISGKWTDNGPITDRQRTDHSFIAFQPLRYAAMMALLLTLACGQMWGAETLAISVSEPTASSYGPTNGVTISGTYQNNKTLDGTGSQKVFKVSSISGTSNTITISSTGANIKKIVTYVSAQTSGTNATLGFDVQTSSDNSTYTVCTSGISISGGASGTTTSSGAGIYVLAYGSHSEVTITFTTPQQYVRITKAATGSNIKETAFKVVSVYTESASCTPCTFKSGDKVYFKDQSSNFDFDALWKVSTGNVYAYFWNDTEKAWSSYGTPADGDWNAANTIYEITVPGSGKEYKHVIFTRGNSNTCFDCSSTWDKTTDQTPCEGKNLFYVSKDKYAPHIYYGDWGNFTPASKTVYFDNRNVTDWTTAYVRIGHGTNNAAWGTMTKVAGTRNLYSQTTSKYISHTDFSIANKAGWTGGNHIDQPEKTYTNGSWSGSSYKMTKQTNYQQYAIEDDIYLCPKATSVLEHECQFYQVTNENSTTSSRIDEYTTALALPQYKVVSTTDHCTVTMEQYTNDALTTSSALSSGSNVDPTRYVGVTVTPSEGYEFGSVTLTENAYEQHTAAAAGVTGKYAIMANCTIAAVCTPCTYTITYKDGGNTAFSGVHIGTQPTSHTYGTATALKKASKAGYVFGGWYTTSACTGDAVTSLGATAYTANITLYAKWTAMSMVNLVKGTFYGASAMVPAGVTVSSTEQAYPGVSTDQRFNMLGSSTSDAMASKTMSSLSLTNASAVTEYLDFKGSASVSSYIPSTKAVQFKVPAAGKLEIWANSGIYLSNGSSETSVSVSDNYATVTVSAGTYYLYAKNTSRKLYGIRFKATHSVSAVTSTGNNTKGSVSADPTTVVEGGTSTITAVPAAGYQVTNWAVSGTGSTISPSGSSSSTTTTLTMGTADATVTVTFGDASYSVTHTLTNVTKSSGGTTATHGTDYTAVFAADDGYNLPNSITVTIGGNSTTSGTEYTWNKATGTVTITGSYITGDIVITVTGVAAVAGDGCWDPENTAADKLSSGDVSLTTFENNFSGVDGITSVTIQSKSTSASGGCSGADDSSGYMKVKNASSSGNKIITIVISSAKDITIGGENYGDNSGSFKLVKSTDESTALATASTGSTAKASNCVAGTYYIYATANTNNKSINFSLLCIEDATPCTTPTTTLGNGAYTVGGSALDLSTLISSSQGGGAITYTVTDANGTGATIAGTSFTASSAGTASIRATQAANGVYCEKVMNATVTVSAAAGHTVTYQYNGATSGATPTSATGASVTLPTPTRTGYEFDGWYTTAGTKAGIGGATYEPEADITLYARWEEECDAEGVAKSTTDVAATGYTTYIEKGGDKVVFTSAPTLGFKYKDADGNIINNSTTSVVRNNAYKCQISSDSGNKGSIKTNNAFSNVDSISFYFAASDKTGCKIAVWCSTDNFSADSTQLLSATTYADNNSEFKLKTLAIPSDKKASALRFKFRFTVTSSGKTSYIDSLKVYSSTSGGGTCYHVYYHGNGAESGFVSDTTSYSDGAKATVLSYNDSRYPLTKEGYDFQGWATSAGGSAAYSDGQKITIDGADVHLYAKWATASTALVTWKMKTADNEAWATTTGTGTTDGTNISSIGTSHDEGDNKAKNSATAKTAMASGEVSSTAAPDKSARFTFSIAGGKQVEISKFDCKVFNVGGGNRTYKAQISDEAGNVYNSTNTVAVSTEATLTDASFVFGSGKILRGDVTIRIYAWKTSGTPTEFRMGPDVKFYGTVQDYACATPSAPTISGVSEYAVGQTITLTASHDGENYDNLTTYTWYRGANWATASAASPVQDADTGEGGYTLTKTAVAADDDLFWCKVSNGTCEAHNTTGYNVNVYAANTITWHLNDGIWGEVEHKDSYTRFDDDYTLPIPSKDGYVFAGWYEASDFSGVPAVILESGSIGDKQYWAKWGTEVTVGWTVTKVDDKLYRGGGGYSVTAVINQANWDDNGDKDDLVLTATEGVTLKNVVKSINGDGKAQVFADFDITTGLAEDATSITFTLEVPAAGTYGPKVAEHEEDLDDCGGSGSDAIISIFKGTSDGDNTNTADAVKYKQDSKWTDAITGFASTAKGVKDALYVFGDNSWSSSNVKVSGTTYVRGIQNGGSDASKYHFKIEIPTGSTATIYLVAGRAGGSANFGLNKSAIAPQSGTHADKVWYASYGSSKVLQGWTIEDVPSGTYYLVGNGGDCIYAELKVTLTSEDGGITPTLSWETDLSGGESKRTSDGGFVHTASQDKNSLGAITYSSNNTAVATVNATTGEVHLEGAAGNATITATIAASGCFDESSISYTITVVDDCDDVAGTISTEDLGCDGIKMTITGHTAAAGVSYQWYKEGSPDVTVGTDQDNYTATAAGSYYVIVTNSGDRHCAKRSRNTVTVEAQAAATATKIVDSWYVKNGRRTPDVELVQTTNAESFTVTNKGTSAVIWNSDSTETTGFGGCGFHLGENGIIYLNGTKDNGDAPSGLTGDADVTLTITAIGCGGNQSKDITIHCQAATTRPSIAFVVDGTKGGAWDAVTSGHASGTDLYDYLNYNESTNATGAFDLTERNVYSTTDEKAIREHYSQFDAILITDDPSTDTKDGGKPSKSYVNAFGTMIDVRPILTMEAYVSKWSNWSAKGIAGNPQSPNPRQYEIRLECKDHEIYKAGLPEPEDGTNVWEEVIDGETFRHVILVDSTKGIYNGVAYNVETAGDKKPALQGFTGEAAGSLLGLGRISEGTLQAAIERQEEPAARLLVMGINAKALHETSALTPEGKIILRNILTYLLKTNMEEVDDCSNYFTGGESGTDTDWSKPSNWSKGNLPSSEAKVRILAPCVISGSQPHVTQVAIVSSGVSGIRKTATGSADCNGKLTIEPDGALIVEGEVLAAKAPHFAHNDLMPTTVEDLIINTNGSGQAALIFNNDAGDTKATVNLYSLGRKIESSYQFQYMAVPMNYIDVNPAFAGSGIYTYVWKEASGWERRAYYAGLSAFEGVGITTTSTSVGNYTLQGALTSTSEKEITLTKASTGQNIVGNSWLAPINIASLRTALVDDDNVDKTVYIYCTGNDNADGNKDVDQGTTETEGQWLAIPIEAAAWGAWTGLKVIPAMQAFCIKANAETTLTLNYKDHVRSAATAQLNQKLRAPKREAEAGGIDLIRIRVADSRTHTDLYLFEGEQFGEEFDNGWEAKYMSGDGRSAKLYAETEIGQMAVAALPELEGTILGFAPGKEAEYTFTFSGPNKEYYLNDLKLKKSALISEDESYLFTFEDGDTNRFYISKTRIDAPAIATGVGDVNGEAQKPHKILYNDKLYILYNGRVYDATGKMVK